MISSVLDFDDQVISYKIYIAYAECNIARLKFLTCFSRCAKHLLAFGALINGQSLDDNDTPLHVAARHGLPDHMELYLRHGAALNLQNDEGNTPLNAACSQPQDCASLKRYSRVCHMLVSAGADIHISGADKQTPLHMACKNANPDVVDLLLKYKALVNEMDTVATHRCITSWRRWPTRRTMSPRGLYRLFSITDPSGCGLELCPRSGLDERAFHSKSHYILIPSQGILMFHKNSEPVLLGIKSLSNSHILAGYTDILVTLF